MNPTEIAPYAIIVFLFIIAAFQFILLRKSQKKKQPGEPKKFGLKNIIGIIPGFKFRTSGLNRMDITDVNELITPVTDITAIRQSKEIIGTGPEIIEPDAKKDVLAEQVMQVTHVTQEAIENDSDLKLEDTLIEIEEENKDIRAAAKKKSKKKKPGKKIELKKKRVEEILPKEALKEIKNAPVVELSVREETHEKGEKKKKKKAARKKVALPHT